jgi:hypothetical protein
MCHSCGNRNPVFSASFGLFYVFNILKGGQGKRR